MKIMVCQDSGLTEREAEPVDIPNIANAKFAVFEHPYMAPDDPKLWSVTHIESGLAAGFGPTRDEAIAAATKRLDAIGERLPAMLDQGMRIRDEVEATDAMWRALDEDGS